MKHSIARLRLLVFAAAVGVGELVAAGRFATPANAQTNEPTAAQAQAVGPLRRHTVPGSGTLEIELPPSWRESVRPAEYRATFEVRGVRSGEFVLLVSLLGAEDFAGMPVDEAVLRGLLSDRLSAARRHSVEKDITLHDVACAAGSGLYFSMTDANHKPGVPGDYRHMTQGGCVLSGGFALLFTLLDNTVDLERRAQALQAVRTARLQTAADLARTTASPLPSECMAAPAPPAQPGATAESLIAEGQGAFQAGRLTEAEEKFRQVLAIAARGERLTVGSAITAAGTLAQALGRMGRHAQSVACHRLAMSLVQRGGLSGRQLAPLRCVQAQALWRGGWRSEARDEIEQLAAAVPGSEGLQMGAMCRMALAIELAKEGSLADAEGLYREALVAFQRIGEGSADARTNVAVAESGLSGVLLGRGKAAESEALARRALPVLERSFGAQAAPVVGTVQNLCAAALAQGNHAGAETPCRRALALIEAMPGHAVMDVCKAAVALATSIGAQARADEAEPLARKALDACTRAAGPDHVMTAIAGRLTGGVLATKGRHVEAEALLRRALDARNCPLNEQVGTAAVLAQVLRAQGREGEAAELERQHGLPPK